jgi:hypothetical protein
MLIRSNEGFYSPHWGILPRSFSLSSVVIKSNQVSSQRLILLLLAVDNLADTKRHLLGWDVEKPIS